MKGPDEKPETKPAGPWPDDEPPPTDEEIAASERLRAALEGGAVHPTVAAEVELAQAVRAAARGGDLAPASQRAALDRALRPRAAGRAGRGKVVYVAFGAAAALTALAAGFALVVTGPGRGGDGATAGRAGPRGGTPAAVVAVSRPTDDLFDEKFPVVGGTSARVDRIASARVADLRANLFSQWGVR